MQKSSKPTLNRNQFIVCRRRNWEKVPINLCLRSKSVEHLFIQFTFSFIIKYSVS